MSDEADEAEAASAMYLAAALRNAVQPVGPPVKLGSCVNCGEDLTGRDNLRACDADCAADYIERVEKMRKLSGLSSRPTLALRDEEDGE